VKHLILLTFALSYVFCAIFFKQISNDWNELDKTYSELVHESHSVIKNLSSYMYR